jgi:hypothetical protein
MHYFASEFTFDLLASWPHDLVALMLGTPPVSAMLLRLIKLLNMRYVFRAYASYSKNKSGDRLLPGLAEVYLAAIAKRGA